MAKVPHMIYNPAAGKGRAGKRLTRVQDLLHKVGFQYELTITEAPGHALALSRRLAEDGCPLVVAAGGDGTINEVINGLMEARVNGSRPALGVLPIGTGNDFAYGADIPAGLEDAAAALAANRRRAIDVGRVTGGNFPQGRYFGNGIGMGFDAVVSFEAAKMKRVKGALSYLAAVWNTIFLYSKAPVYEVDLDGRQVRQPFLMISTMNGRRLGGMFMVAPNGSNSDGLFDVCLAGQVSQLGIVAMVPRFLKGTQAQHPAVEIARARRLHVRAVEGSIPAHADGETICTAAEELTIELLPGALEVVSQAEAPGGQGAAGRCRSD